LFIHNRSSERWGIFYAAGGNKPEAFFGFTQIDATNPTAPESLFALRAAQKLIGSPDWCANSAEKSGGPGGLSRLQPWLLRVLFRRSRKQQAGNRLP
jgi:hypothetical protein